MIRLLFILFLFISFCGQAQILNVEQQRIVTDTTGWAGKIGLNSTASQFTKSVFSFTGLGHAQYKSKKDLFLIVVNYNIVNAGGERFDNRGFAHFRYNRKWNKIVRWEYFMQIQFNSLTKIRQRTLIGAGPRFKLSTYEKAKFYFGVAYMFEYEELVEPVVFHNDHRLSSYFTFTLVPEKTVSLTNTSYIQPMIGNPRDLRVSNDTQLNFGIRKNLKFTASLAFLWDAEPPIDIPSLNYVLTNGIQYTFK